MSIYTVVYGISLLIGYLALMGIVCGVIGFSTTEEETASAPMAEKETDTEGCNPLLVSVDRAGQV